MTSTYSEVFCTSYPLESQSRDLRLKGTDCDCAPNVTRCRKMIWYEFKVLKSIYECLESTRNKGKTGTLSDTYWRWVRRLNRCMTKWYNASTMYSSGCSTITKRKHFEPPVFRAIYSAGVKMRESLLPCPKIPGHRAGEDWRQIRFDAGSEFGGHGMKEARRRGVKFSGIPGCKSLRRGS